MLSTNFSVNQISMYAQYLIKYGIAKSVQQQDTGLTAGVGFLKGAKFICSL